MCQIISRVSLCFYTEVTASLNGKWAAFIQCFSALQGKVRHKLPLIHTYSYSNGAWWIERTSDYEYNIIGTVINRFLIIFCVKNSRYTQVFSINTTVLISLSLNTVYIK